MSLCVLQVYSYPDVKPRRRVIGEMAHQRLFCLVFLLILPASGGNSCSNFDVLWDFAILHNLSNALTGKTYVYVGEQLELTCTLDDSLRNKCSSKDISFFVAYPLKFGSEAPEDSCLPASNVKLVDSSRAVLLLDNITVRNESAQYSCHVGPEHCSQEHLVGVAEDIQVEYAPHNVTNFRCVVRNWNEGMECTWEHPVEYVNWLNVQVNLTFADFQSKTPAPCPNLNRTSCVWKNNQEFSATSRYMLEINVTNLKRGDYAQRLFTVVTRESVRPSPVENLQIKPVSGKEGCLELTWIHRKEFRSKVFRVKHRAFKEAKFKILKSNFTLPYLTTCGYGPMTRHVFAVDCYPSGVYSGYWSEQNIQEFTTPQTVPLLGPQISNGSYVSTACNNGHRNITVLWDDVKEDARNGIITDVSIWVSGLLKWKGPVGVYSATVKLGCGRFFLDLVAHNDAGWSREPSRIIIPSAEETVIPQVLHESFSVEVTREANQAGNLLAVWQSPDEAESSAWASIIIFWCRGRWLKQQCTGPISGQAVPSSVNRVNISANITDATDFLFGIALEYKDKQRWSQIFWTNCLYNKHAELVPAPRGLEVEADREGIKARWRSVSCSYTSLVKVDKYIVRWRKSRVAINDSYKETVGSTTSSYRIDSLEAETPYLVSVQSKSLNQLGGRTEWKEAVTLKNDGNTILLGLSVGLTMSLLVIILFVCLVRRCYLMNLRVRKDVTMAMDLMESSSNERRSSPPHITQKANHQRSERDYTEVEMTEDSSAANTDCEEYMTSGVTDSGSELIPQGQARGLVSFFSRWFRLGDKKEPESPKPVSFMNRLMDVPALAGEGNVLMIQARQLRERDTCEVVEGQSEDGNVELDVTDRTPSHLDQNVAREGNMDYVKLQQESREEPLIPREAHFSAGGEQDMGVANNQEEVFSTENQDNRNSSCGTGPNNAMAFSELPAEVVAISEAPQHDSVSSYIHVDVAHSDSVENSEQSIQLPEMFGGSVNTDIVAMNVEQCELRHPDANSFPPCARNVVFESESPAKVVGEELSLQSSVPSPVHAPASDYVSHGVCPTDDNAVQVTFDRDSGKINSDGTPNRLASAINPHNTLHSRTLKADYLSHTSPTISEPSDIDNTSPKETIAPDHISHTLSPVADSSSISHVLLSSAEYISNTSPSVINPSNRSSMLPGTAVNTDYIAHTSPVTGGTSDTPNTSPESTDFVTSTSPSVVDPSNVSSTLPAPVINTDYITHRSPIVSQPSDTHNTSPKATIAPDHVSHTLSSVVDSSSIPHTLLSSADYISNTSPSVIDPSNIPSTLPATVVNTDYISHTSPVIGGTSDTPNTPPQSNTNTSPSVIDPVNISSNNTDYISHTSPVTGESSDTPNTPPQSNTNTTPSVIDPVNISSNITDYISHTSPVTGESSDTPNTTPQSNTNTSPSVIDPVNISSNITDYISHTSPVIGGTSDTPNTSPQSNTNTTPSVIDPVNISSNITDYISHTSPVIGGTSDTPNTPPQSNTNTTPSVIDPVNISSNNTHSGIHDTPTNHCP